MPIYEYICSDCGLKFELLRTFSEAENKASCPRCHNSAKRTVSACASFLKNESGETSRVAGTGSSCASCGASSCSTCGL